MENEIEHKGLELKRLGNFYGTEQYHKVFPGISGTDGIDYVMRNGYSWAVTDACAVLRTVENVKKEEFVAINLKLPGDGTAELVYEDGNENILFTQKYKVTDAKREFTMYYTDGILLLSGEY